MKIRFILIKVLIKQTRIFLDLRYEYRLQIVLKDVSHYKFGIQYCQY